MRPDNSWGPPSGWGRTEPLWGQERDVGEVTGPAESNILTLFSVKKKKSLQKTKRVCRDFGFWGKEELSIGRTKVSYPLLTAHFYVLLSFLIYDKNISAAGKQTNLFNFPPVFGMNCTKVLQENVGESFFFPVAFDGEVPVSWLAIMVLLGSKVQDGTWCDAELKGQDLLRQSGTH